MPISPDYLTIQSGGGGAHEPFKNLEITRSDQLGVREISL